nr:MerR family DNA-binding protein [Mycobacterium intracellulare]
MLRRQQDMGQIYARGRSRGGYRLFDENALWCVRIVRALRDLGVTEAEIQQLAQACDTNPGLIGPPLAALLDRSRARIDERIQQLEQQRQRIDTFAHSYRDALTGQVALTTADPWGPVLTNPAVRLDSPTGGRPDDRYRNNHAAQKGT